MRKTRQFVALLTVAAAMPVGISSAAASCAPAAPSNEWPSYGSDMSNSRNQDGETVIGPENVGQLQGAWAFSVAANAGNGSVQSTTAVADGCIFVTTSLGSVFAANAETGETVWSTKMSRVPGASAGAAIYAPSVVDGRVHILGNMGKPFSAALDQATGEILWQTDFIEKDAGIFDAASAVVSHGLVFAATTYGDAGSDPTSRPPFWILDAATGEILKKTYVIPAEDGLKGYGGGGIWSTAAVDQETKHLYVGTANPYSRRMEHERTNSIIKVDMDRSSPTFGEIIGNYKGTADSDPSLVNTPQCQFLGDIPLAAYSFFCGQYDVDMAAAPQLFTDDNGRKLVGILQKNGIYHVADATTMAPVWRTRLAPFYRVGGHAATAAYDDHAIYVNTDEGKLDALDKTTGKILWTASYDDPGGKFQPVSVANGVVYVLHHNGSMHAFDAVSGEHLLEAPLEASGLSCNGTAGAGITIARNTVYVGCDAGSDGAGMVFALRLPA